MSKPIHVYGAPRMGDVPVWTGTQWEPQSVNPRSWGNMHRHTEHTPSVLVKSLESPDYKAGVSGWRIAGSGDAEFYNIVARGNITAETGSIGGWTVASGHLYSGTGANQTGLRPADYPFYAGAEDPSAAPFRVTPAGALYATNATIEGQITAETGSLGDLYVSGVVTVGEDAPYIEIDGGHKRIRSSNYAPHIAGFNIDQSGDAEFNNVRVRGSLTSTVFVKGLIEARAGSLIVVKSAGVLAEDMEVPASGTWHMLIEDPPGGGFLFDNNDIFRCRTEYEHGIADIWGTLSEKEDVGDGTQRYRCAYISGPQPATYPAGAPVLDYGVGGDGGLYLTADDADGPFLSQFTHTGVIGAHKPWENPLEHLRIGNLRNLADYGAVDTYGIFIGDYAEGNWLSYDPTAHLRLHTGDDSIVLDSEGIRLDIPIAWATKASFRWVDGNNDHVSFAAYKSTNALASRINVHGDDLSVPTRFIIDVFTGIGQDAELELTARQDTGGTARFLLKSTDAMNDHAQLANADLLITQGDARIRDGLYIGLTNVAPAEKLHVYSGSVWASTKIRVQGGGSISSGLVSGVDLYRGTDHWGSWQLDATGTMQFWARRNNASAYMDFNTEAADIRFWAAGNRRLIVTPAHGVRVDQGLYVGAWSGTPGAGNIYATQDIESGRHLITNSYVVIGGKILQNLTGDLYWGGQQVAMV